jgi:hypothetical protein
MTPSQCIKTYYLSLLITDTDAAYGNTEVAVGQQDSERDLVTR